MKEENTEEDKTMSKLKLLRLELEIINRFRDLQLSPKEFIIFYAMGLDAAIKTVYHAKAIVAGKEREATLEIIKCIQGLEKLTWAEYKKAYGEQP